MSRSVPNRDAFAILSNGNLGLLHPAGFTSEFAFQKVPLALEKEADTMFQASRV